ncbi:MAG: tripartite tricarboxylate transporter substrate binding protein [Proteobacteria bacterium]|nr:tripartite tricarboxylate transporter substrate binding protein [Pseudomonadota bacterium]
MKLLLALLVSVVALAPAQAQNYPTHAIRIVVPFPPGGFSDLYARAIGTRMAETFGQSVVVENRPGAGGNIATDLVAKSAPDGYTLAMGTIGTHAINATLFPKLPYDPVKDFTAVSFVVDADGLLVAHTSVKANTVGELIELAKKEPGVLNYASAGPGTTSHLAAEIFKQRTGTQITHIPYKGNVPALLDVVAGNAQISFATMATVLPHVKSGRLKALGVLGSQRSSALPAVPTIAESGVPGFDVGNWTGLFAPAGTPAPIVAKLHAEAQRVMKLPEVQARLGDEGLRFVAMTQPKFAEFVQGEVKRWGEVVKRVGVTAE